MNLEHQIKEARAKPEGLLQTKLAIARERYTNVNHMETCRNMHHTPNHMEVKHGKKKMQQCQPNTWSHPILKVPTSTPREALYIEIGLIDANHTRLQKRVAMLHRINATKSVLLDKTLQNPNKQAWKPKTEQLMKDMNLQTSTDEESKNTIKKRWNKPFIPSFKPISPSQVHKKAKSNIS